MKRTSVLRWTRNRVLEFSFSRFETFESLIGHPRTRERLAGIADSFGQAREDYHAQGLNWQRGIFFFGPSGSGKSAATRAMALRLGWDHLTVPAHEILDAHYFEHALCGTMARARSVVVLEDVDRMIQRMEPQDFFTLLDHAIERSDSCLWIATTRHPGDTPKSLMVRPGRFEESMRFELPPPPLREEILRRIPAFQSLEPEALTLQVEATEGLSLAQFEEMRRLCFRLKQEARESDALAELTSYIQDQVISGDRQGGTSDLTDQLEERVKNVDPRVLMAALDMSDTFRTLIEKTIGDAAEKARQDDLDQGS